MSGRISYAQRVRIFGVAGNRRNTVTVRTPWGMDAVVHRVIVEPFKAACDEAAATVRWRPQRCDSFAYRPIRNATSLSLHSWALACDWFATPPGVAPPGGVWTPANAVPAEFARCFERRGFYWGARFSRRRDVPHIEWPGGVPGVVVPPAIPAPTPARHLQIPPHSEVDMFVYRQSGKPTIKLCEGKGRCSAIPTPDQAARLMTVLDQRPDAVTHPDEPRSKFAITEWVLPAEDVAWLESPA